MREEQLGLQARGVDVFLGEEIGAFLNGFKDGHSGKAKGGRRKAKG